ncbi:NADH dehydrogenase [ubiquinone] 1 alpha subcomplex subunit 13-like [Gigantopelta aegis]|uniref:NADH dehydrogenase [ubiquinone] 1 alpha subcomplex subunit 13-like n=1 Tax=Gigantopelta aegis TaxID=1735272 RepID=UPI001B88D6E7|nr:NADH dehydrogenase [ubiquinone] 1 alpha subcomplex subunit 13-like [Gigantopelta aegis]
MASQGFRQEMPRSGGYQNVDWAKKIPVRKWSGYSQFGAFIAFTSVAWVAYWYDKKRMKTEELEMRDARIAIIPLLQAERDRLFLIQQRKNRDEENELMKDVPGWKTGTLWGKPVYHNIRDRYITPATEEFFAHSSYWDKYSVTMEKLKH